MNSFVSKQETPTTDEYLKVSFEQVLDRLNRNPAQSQSEGEFIHAVITVRNAMITERLSRQMIYLTTVVAFSTALLVIVPFFIPSLEVQKLESEILATKTAYNDLKLELEKQKKELYESKQALLALKNLTEKINNQQHSSK